MTKLSLLIAISLSGMLCLTGCGGSDGDDSGDAAADPAAPTAPSSSSSNPGSAPAAAPVANPAAAPAANPDAAADAAFAKVEIWDFDLDEKIPLGGQGMVYKFSIKPQAGAVSYTMTASFGDSKTSSTPQVTLTKTGPDQVFDIYVYATNANGVHTKTTHGQVQLNGDIII